MLIMCLNTTARSLAQGRHSSDCDINAETVRGPPQDLAGNTSTVHLVPQEGQSIADTEKQLFSPKLFYSRASLCIK